MATITRDLLCRWGAAGLTGTLAYRVVDGAGATLVARTTAGVAEFPAGSGEYHVAVATWDAAWVGRVVWDAGGSGVGAYAVESFDAMSEAGGGSTGTGDTPIDHNGGDGVTVDGDAPAADCMRHVDADGAGVDGLTIVAYLAGDYDADPPIRTRAGLTATGSDGRWVAPLMLDAGTYYLIADAARDDFPAVQTTVVVP